MNRGGLGDSAKMSRELACIRSRTSWLRKRAGACACTCLCTCGGSVVGAPVRGAACEGRVRGAEKGAVWGGASAAAAMNCSSVGGRWVVAGSSPSAANAAEKCASRLWRVRRCSYHMRASAAFWGLLNAHAVNASRCSFWPCIHAQVISSLHAGYTVSVHSCAAVYVEIACDGPILFRYWCSISRHCSALEPILQYMFNSHT